MKRRSPLRPCTRESTCTARSSRARWRQPSGCSPSRPIRSAAARTRIHGRAACRHADSTARRHCARRRRHGHERRRGGARSPGRRAAESGAAKSSGYRMPVSVNYHIKHYDLVQGALEIQYIEEYFGEFPRKKTAAEIVRRLEGRSHLILLATAPLPDDPGTVVPVSFKVAHEVRVPEAEPKLVDLVHRLSDNVQFPGRKVL